MVVLLGTPFEVLFSDKNQLLLKLFKILSHSKRVIILFVAQKALVVVVKSVIQNHSVFVLKWVVSIRPTMTD